MDNVGNDSRGEVLNAKARDHAVYSISIWAVERDHPPIPRNSVRLARALSFETYINGEMRL